MIIERRIEIVILLILLCLTCGFSQTKNPFDVNVSDTIDSELIIEPNQVESSNNIFDVRVEDKALRKIEETKSLNLQGTDNPFEVDHIPLRRGQIERKISSAQRTSSFNQNSKTSYYYLPLIIILLSCILLAIILVQKRQIVVNIVRSLNNLNFAKSFQRTELGGLSTGMLGIYLIFLLNFGLFIFLAIKTFNKGVQLNFYWIVFGILLVYAFRHIILRITGWLFNVDKLLSPYNFIIQLANSAYGLILIPLNLLLAYGPDLLSQSLVYGSILIFMLLLLIRYFRGFILGSQLKSGFSFHFFIYFCTFEILPFLIGFKFLSQFQG